MMQSQWPFERLSKNICHRLQAVCWRWAAAAEPSPRRSPGLVTRSTRSIRRHPGHHLPRRLAGGVLRPRPVRRRSRKPGPSSHSRSWRRAFEDPAAAAARGPADRQRARLGTVSTSQRRAGTLEHRAATHLGAPSSPAAMSRQVGGIPRRPAHLRGDAHRARPNSSRSGSSLRTPILNRQLGKAIDERAEQSSDRCGRDPGHRLPLRRRGKCTLTVRDDLRKLMAGPRSAIRPGARSSSASPRARARSASSPSELPVSRPAVSQHLKVLKDAGPGRRPAAPATGASTRSTATAWRAARRARPVLDQRPGGLQGAPSSNRRGEPMSTPGTGDLACATRSSSRPRSSGRSRSSPRTSAASSRASTTCSASTSPRRCSSRAWAAASTTAASTAASASWARVLAYEPPDRVVFSWDISPHWQIETDPDEDERGRGALHRRNARAHARRARAPQPRPPRRRLGRPARGRRRRRRLAALPPEVCRASEGLSDRTWRDADDALERTS